MSTLGRRWPRRFQMRVGLPLTVDSAAGAAEVSQAQKSSARPTQAGEALPAPTSLIASLPGGKGSTDPLRFIWHGFLPWGWGATSASP